ncbi:protein of unassigned function [Methylobacterium oryzae CBMB20]|uniref:Protein of unassigned function n=1 Tax=Methylobacterium oryzae CBMB20 TaxID=693986 RepID=A0A089NVI6_9HYPH|nr:protein of unassigned function [Methylobacterium oryzae CBMB20]
MVAGPIHRTGLRVLSKATGSTRPVNGLGSAQAAARAADRAGNTTDDGRAFRDG